MTSAMDIETLRSLLARLEMDNNVFNEVCTYRLDGSHMSIAIIRLCHTVILFAR